MILTKQVLILEDNLLVLARLLSELHKLEGDQPNELSLVILTTAEQVQKYINSDPNPIFDVIILDRDDKLNRSFHILDIERFGAEKVIAISTVKEYNEEARVRGVTRIVEKDLRDIDEFAGKVIKEIESIFRDNLQTT